MAFLFKKSIVILFSTDFFITSVDKDMPSPSKIILEILSNGNVDLTFPYSLTTNLFLLIPKFKPKLLICKVESFANFLAYSFFFLSIFVLVSLYDLFERYCS